MVVIQLKVDPLAIEPAGECVFVTVKPVGAAGQPMTFTVSEGERMPTPIEAEPWLVALPQVAGEVVGIVIVTLVCVGVPLQLSEFAVGVVQVTAGSSEVIEPIG